MTRDFEQLTTLTDVLYQADAAKLKAIAAEEARLREELAALAAAERAAEPGSGLALRRIGGDILWQGWVGRKREALNLQLAAVMARKLSAAQVLRRSYGRNMVAQELQSAARHRIARDKGLKTLADEQAQMVLRGARES